MAAAGTAGDAFRAYLTGAGADGEYQGDPASSLGGFRSAIESRSLVARRANGVRGLVIDQIGGRCGPGLARLSATGSSVSFAAPGEEFGAEVAIAAGETQLIESETASKWVRVTRSAGSASVEGDETLTLIEVLDNAVAGGEVSDALAASGGSTYRALMFRAEVAIEQVTFGLVELAAPETTDTAQLGASGAGTIGTSGSLAGWPVRGFAMVLTDAGSTREMVYYPSRTDAALTVPATGRGLGGTSAGAGAADDQIVPVPGIRFAIETPGMGGDIQTIADEETAPTGLTWSIRTETQLTSIPGPATIATLAAGETAGVWIERIIPEGMVGDAAARVWLRDDWIVTAGMVQYLGNVRGRHRVVNDALSRFELYHGVDAAPDFAAAPADTSASLDFVVALTADARNTIAVRRRNKYNLVSRNTFATAFDVDAGGALEADPPSAPDFVGGASRADGTLRIEAAYNPLQDASPADTWLVWWSVGSAPDPDSDPADATVSMGTVRTNVARLNYTTADTFLSGAAVHVIVRTQRSGDGKESENAAATILTADALAPGRPDGFASLDNTLAILPDAPEAPESPADDYEIDAGESLRLEFRAGSTALYWDTALIFAYVVGANGAGRLYFPTGWSEDVTLNPGGAAGAAEPFELIGTGPDQATMNANALQWLLFDATDQKIGYYLRDEVTPFTGQDGTPRVFASVAGTWLQVWSPYVGDWVSFMKLETDGTWRLAGVPDFSLDQTGIEALL